MADRDISLRLAVTDAEASIRRLREFGAQGDAALSRIGAASRPATAGLNAINSASLGMQRGLSFAIPTIASFAAGMAAAVAAPLSFAAALSAGVQASAEAEKSFLRLESVIKATGGSAGLTARQISAFAEGLERSTLNSSEAVKDAAAALATFKSISGTAFTDALRTSADLAAVFGGSLASNASQLGKALEEPVRGLDSLREKGVTFSASQRDVIKSLVETGEVAEAQRVILDTLAGQVGGAAEGEASGLAGAFHRFNAELGDTLQLFAEASGSAGVLQRSLEGLAGYLSDIQGAISEDIGRDVVALQRQIAELEKLRDAGIGGSIFGPSGADRADITARIAALREEQEALIAKGRAENDAARAAKEAGVAAAAAAEEERRTGQLRAVVADVNKRSAEAEKKAQEAAATAAKRHAESVAKALDAARVAADQQTRLRAALEDSVDAYDAVAKAIEVENALRAVNLDATSAEGKALAAAITQRQAEAEAIDRVRAARERLAKMEDDRRRRIEDRGFDPTTASTDYYKGQEQSRAESRRAAEREAEALAAIFVRAVDRIGQTLADTMADYRHGELDNFEDFAASIGDIMAAPFEQLSGAVFSSLFSGIVEDLSTQIKAAAAGGQFDVSSFIGAFNNPLGAAALGASIGGMGAQALGVGNNYTSLGGGLGAGLGFAAGSYFLPGVGGPIGGVLGGLLGTGIAAAFGGGGGGERDNVGTHVYFDDLTVDPGGTPNKNTERARQLGEQVAALVSGMRAQGIEFDEGGKIRFNVNNGRGNDEILRGATGVVRDMARSDDPLIKQILARSTAGTPAGLLGDIEFGRLFGQITGAAGPAEAALRALNVQFDDAARKAKALGLDEAALAEARAKATRDLVRSAEDAVLAQADGIRSIFESRTGPLQSAIDSIRIGGGSALSTEEQLGLVRGQFDELARQAEAGSLVDYNRLAGLGQQVVGLARDFDASGSLFQDVFKDVNFTLQRVLDEQTGRQDDLLSALPDALRDAQRDQTEILAERLDSMLTELERLNRAVELQARVA